MKNNINMAGILFAAGSVIVTIASLYAAWSLFFVR